MQQLGLLLEQEYIIRLIEFKDNRNIENAIIGEEISIKYFIEISSGAASKYEGRKLALIITAPNDIPYDTSLTL